MGQAENKHLFIVICINRSECGPKLPSLYFAAVQKLLYYPSWKMVTSESAPQNPVAPFSLKDGQVNFDRSSMHLWSTLSSTM